MPQKRANPTNRNRANTKPKNRQTSGSISIRQQPRPPNTTATLEILPGTRPTTIDRIPKIIEGLADGKPVKQIAEELGIDRVTVWKNLQRVDFRPIVSLAVTKVLEDMEKIENPKDRAWLNVQLMKALHSKKIKTEGTLTLHRIDEKRQTLRLELDRLTPDEQAELQRLQAKMIVVDAETEDDDKDSNNHYE